MAMKYSEYRNTVSSLADDDSCYNFLGLKLAYNNADLQQESVRRLSDPSDAFKKSIDDAIQDVGAEFQSIRRNDVEKNGVKLFEGCGHVDKMYTKSLLTTKQNVLATLSSSFFPFSRIQTDDFDSFFDGDPRFLGRILGKWLPGNHRDSVEAFKTLSNLTLYPGNSGGTPNRWANTFGISLSAYFVDFFNDKFVDRDGNKVSFKFKDDLTKILTGDFLTYDYKSTGVDLVSQLGSILIEFISDEVTRIPFYSAEYLALNRRKYKTQGNLDQAIPRWDRIKKLLADLTIAGNVNELRGIFDPSMKITPEANDLNFSYLAQSSGTNTDLPSNYLVRLGLSKVQELDRGLSDSSILLNKIETDISDGKGLDYFTCKKAGVIDENLQGIFFSDSGGSGLIGNVKYLADDDGERKQSDYSDLIGRMIISTGNTVEKFWKAITGGLVRGISLGSLDNEILAEFLSSVLSVTSKKVAQKVIYKALVKFVTQGDPDLNVPKRDFLALIDSGLGISESLAEVP